MKILIIPDCQVKPGIPTDHLEWAGKAICDYRPDVVVNIGDFADMPSLSTHDKVGSKYFEGKRYKDDIAFAKIGMKKLLKPLRDLQASQKANKTKVYKPRMVMTLGNHENRINRAVANWEVHEFLRPLFINGVGFCHYWPVGVMGRPASSATVIVNKLHMSCVAGHQQGKQVAYGKRADGKAICGIIAGSFYLHDEDYMDQLSNKHWRGLVVLNEVEDGAFDEMFLSMNYLQKKYAHPA
jgi:hypothetical protein